MDRQGYRLKQNIIAVLVVIAMLFSIVPATVQTVYAADTAYDFQPKYPKDAGMNSVMLYSPSDITVVEETDTYIMNRINTVVDGTVDIKFTFSMSAGINSFNEAGFIKNNMPVIKIYDSTGQNIAAEYSNGAGELKFLGSAKSDELNNWGSNKTTELYIGVDQGVLMNGEYILEFGKNLCGNNTSKILGKDVRFTFTVKATKDLEELIDIVQDFLTEEKIGTEPGQYPADSAEKLQAALTAASEKLAEINAQVEAGTLTEDEAVLLKDEAAQVLDNAFREFKDSRIVDIKSITIDGIGSSQYVGDTGAASAAVTVDPDEAEYKKIMWSASDNIEINPVSGQWTAIYAGDGWVRATSKSDPSVSKQMDVTVKNEDGVTGVMVTTGSVMDAISAAAGDSISEVTALKLFTAQDVAFDETTVAAIREAMPELKTLDIENVFLTEIGSGWFKEWTSLETVVLPETLETIGLWAFYNCTGLKNVDIPVSVKTIGSSAFAGCTSMDPVMTIASPLPPSMATAVFESQGFGDSFKGISTDEPAAVTTIRVPYGCKDDYKAASGWKRFKIVEMEEKVLDVHFSVMGGLAAAAEKELKAKGWEDQDVTRINISSPADVEMEKITDMAYLQTHFLGATVVDLTGTNLPNDNVQAKTFYGRKNAKEIILPADITHIGRQVFYGCSNLRTLTIPEGVYYVSADNPGIGESSLAECPNLKTLIMLPVDPPGYLGSMPTSVTEIYVPNLSMDAYKEVYSGDSYTLKPVASVSVADVSVEAMKTKQLTADVSSVASVDLPLKWEIASSQDADNPIAVIDEETGVVTACRYGSVRIKVTAGYNTPFQCVDVCTVTVTKAPAVTAKAASASYNSAKVSWSAMTGAEGYQIFRATFKDGTYSLKKTVSASTRSYTDTGLTTGKTYYYKVRGYKTVNGVKVYGEYSAVKSAKPVPAAPSVTAKRYSYNSNKISWGGVSGAHGYKIYRATSKSGTYSLIATKGKDVRSYVDTKRTTGKTYYYKVRAYRTVNDSPVYSAYSAVKSAVPTLSKVSTVKTAKAGTRKIKVTWSSVSGATGYKVYRSTKKTSGFKVVKTVKAGKTRAYTSGKLTKNKKYYFKVRAYRVVNGKTIYGPYSSVVYRTAK